MNNNHQTTNKSVADTPNADCRLKQLHCVGIKRSKLYVTLYMMQHYQHNKRTQIFLLYCFTSLLQFQIIKEQYSEEYLVKARYE